MELRRIVWVSKLTKIIILLSLVIHAGIFIFFAVMNGENHLLRQSFGDDRVNLFAINDKWASYAELLESVGINSFWLLGSIDFVVQFLVSFFLFKLFALYERGEAFSRRNCTYIGLIGTTLFAYGLAMAFSPWLISVVANMVSSQYQLDASAYFGSAELSQLVLGTVILTISWIMGEACNLKNGQDPII